ncbi:MAG: hypothetical protein J5906_10420, partial [Acidaminococcaceae bacterium]|nr:hypothetical protein [Acidaminococcaceae bacterium]
MTGFAMAGPAKYIKLGKEKIMNKIYLIIWSKTKNCWIVVSEIAKRHGKTATQRGGRVVLSALVAASLLAGTSVCRPVWAGIKTNDGAVLGQIESGTASGLASMVAGVGNTASGDLSFSFGQYSVASDYLTVAFGTRTIASGTHSTAFGQDTEASGNYSVAFGGAAYYSDGTLERKVIASGPHATAFGSGSHATGYLATAFGASSTSKSLSSLAFGQGTIAGVDDAEGNGQLSTAFGRDTRAYADASTAFGILTQAGSTDTKGTKVMSGTASTAFGKDTRAYADYSTAFGLGSQAGITDGTGKAYGGTASVAFGKDSKAFADNSLAALGGKTETNAEGSAAIGVGATVSQAGTVALGAESKAGTESGISGFNPLGAGKTSANPNAWKSTHAAIAVGNGSAVTRQITGVAAGTAPTDAVNVAQLSALADAVGDSALAIKGTSGSGSVRLANQTLSVIGGNNNITTAADGQEIKVNLSNSLNLGTDGRVAFGTGTNPTTLNSSGLTINGGPSVTTGGINAGGKKITGVAAGTDNTDAVNLQQLKAAVADVDFDPVLNTSGNSGTGSVNLKSGKLNVIGADGNITTTASGEDIRIGLSNNVDVTTLHATTVSATTVTADTVDTMVLHAGPSLEIGPGSKITGLAAGTDPMDAVNYGQLTAVQNQLDNVHFNVANSSTGTGTSR